MGTFFQLYLRFESEILSFADLSEIFLAPFGCV